MTLKKKKKNVVVHKSIRHMSTLNLITNYKNINALLLFIFIFLEWRYIQAFKLVPLIKKFQIFIYLLLGK